MNTPSFARATLARTAFAAIATIVACSLSAPAFGASATVVDGSSDATVAVGSAAADALEPTPAGLRLVVNIPAYRLDAFLADELVGSWPVTVGKSYEPTFEGRFTIDSVIWNPWWHPPANRQPKDKVTPPGPRNPMGRVKLPLYGLYYIHGTAKDSEIGRPTSRGCVRMRNEDVLTLARLIHQHASPNLPTAEIDRLARNSGATRHLKLALPVPVEVRYQVVEVRDGSLEVHPDVYRQETRPLAELAALELARSGYAPEQLDATLLADAVAVEKESRTVPVESLVLGEATGLTLAAGAAGGSSMVGGAATVEASPQR